MDTAHQKQMRKKTVMVKHILQQFLTTLQNDKKYSRNGRLYEGATFTAHTCQAATLSIILNITWHTHFLTNTYMHIVTKDLLPLHVLFHHREAECGVKTLNDESASTAT